jgi:hypothetical protein
MYSVLRNPLKPPAINPTYRAINESYNHAGAFDQTPYELRVFLAECKRARPPSRAILVVQGAAAGRSASPLFLRARLLTASKRTIPAVTDTFSDATCPRIGTETIMSHLSRTKR